MQEEIEELQDRISELEDELETALIEKDEALSHADSLEEFNDELEDEVDSLEQQLADYENLNDDIQVIFSELYQDYHMGRGELYNVMLNQRVFFNNHEKQAKAYQRGFEDAVKNISEIRP